MASSFICSRNAFLLLFLVLVSFLHQCYGARKLTALYQPEPSERLAYHNGAVLEGDIPVSILWYGHFTPSQKSIISDFLLSLTPSSQLQPKISTPSVPEWWNTIEKLYLSKVTGKTKKLTKKTKIFLAGQVANKNCSLGKSLTMSQVAKLAAKARPKKGGIALVFTSQDVAVEGFCQSRCGTHGSVKAAKTVYIWVGNPATQCPGQCAWPFHQPIYGPQGSPLGAPNGDIGADGIIISLASLIAGAVTNPYGDGFFQGPKDAALEAATACTGVYGKGAYPGYAGELLVDRATGASYNANGARGRKYLLPGLFNPATSTCSTLV